MPLRAGAHLRHVLLDDRFRELGHDLVEMQMLQQFKPGRAEDVRVLQNLHGIETNWPGLHP